MRVIKYQGNNDAIHKWATEMKSFQKRCRGGQRGGKEEEEEKDKKEDKEEERKKRNGNGQ